MPVPVSITNPGGLGLAAYQLQELPTVGPFARKAQAGEGARTGDASTSTQGDAAQPSPEVSASGRAPANGVNDDLDSPAVLVSHLDFSYPGLDGRPIPGLPPVVRDMSMSLPRGSLCLLVGPNGAGKTTLLKVLAGKHMVPESAVQVLGRPPFHDTALTMSGELSYVGGNWERDVAFAGYAVPLQGDFPARQMIDLVPGVDPARKERLIQVMGINPRWRMHRVSDGQRRRVQICLGLLREFRVLLLDEVTVDLDVLARAALMRFLRDECETRGTTVVYCTHIFDGLEGWPTHLAYVAGGRLRLFGAVGDIPELNRGARLMDVVLEWLREEKKERDEARKSGGPAVAAPVGQVLWNNGYSSGTLNASIKLASNAVWRG